MEPILHEWENFARSIQPAESEMDVGELRDHAQEMLRAIAADMQTPQTERERAEKSKGNKPREPGSTSAAETHATSRLASGFSINLLAAEYRALRSSVLQLWLREHEIRRPEQVEDLIRFNEAIDQSLAESIARYTEIVQREQNVFLGILGHDLRNPLQSISHSAQYLIYAGDRDSAQWGARMLNSVKRMAGMIDNLLDFTQSRIGGGIKIVLAEADLPGIAEQVVAEFRLNNPERLIHNKIKGNCKGRWDPVRLAQVYQNLISNALQYGDQYRPVAVTSEGGPEDVVIRVHNDGMPIPEREQERLFDLLHRRTLAEGEENSRRNLGLGLYIVREIVLAHCGTIAVISTEAEGTDFVVRLPKQPPVPCEPIKSHQLRMAHAMNLGSAGKDPDSIRMH